MSKSFLVLFFKKELLASRQTRVGKKTKLPRGSISTVESGWQDVVLICRKCTRKMKGGFGPVSADTLKSALREGLKIAGLRGRVGLIEVACFGVCPKGAVTLAFGSRADALFVVARGTSAGDVLERARANG